MNTRSRGCQCRKCACYNFVHPGFNEPGFSLIGPSHATSPKPHQGLRRSNPLRQRHLERFGRRPSGSHRSQRLREDHTASHPGGDGDPRQGRRHGAARNESRLPSTGGLSHSGRTLREEATSVFAEVLALRDEQRELEEAMGRLDPEHSDYRAVLKRYGNAKKSGIGRRDSASKDASRKSSAGWGFKVRSSKRLPRRSAAAGRCVSP